MTADPKTREPPHCSTCSCGVLADFHNLDDLREIEQLRKDLAIQAVNAKTVADLEAEIDRLDKKCAALAMLVYGKPARTSDCPHCPGFRDVNGILLHANGCIALHGDVPAAIAFRHWSKDPLLPYQGCDCRSCADARATSTRGCSGG